MGERSPGMTATDRFWEQRSARHTRRGNFWIPGERVAVGPDVYQHGPMYVAWEAPEAVTGRLPVVLVHGGAIQGTEWLDTPDGRPGWAQRLVEAGYPTFVVDRPTQGRSPYHPAVSGPQWQDRHTQWPFDTADAPALDSFIAAFGPLPADLAQSERMDADRLADLLDRIGPAIIVTHSASGPDGWLLADRRPDLVAAIVTVEPMGPAFAAIPHIGTLQWGLAAAPLSYDPPLTSPDQASSADSATLRIPALADLPVAVVTGGASPFGLNGPSIVGTLRAAGALAEQLHLPDHGVHGNGHGLIYEKNSDQALAVVLDWLEKHADRAQIGPSPTPESPKPCEVRSPSTAPR
jgi:pimeloyl-ACP methyl ester carboxylesterase